MGCGCGYVPPFGPFYFAMQISNPPSIIADTGSAPRVKAQGDWIAAAFADRPHWKQLQSELARVKNVGDWDLQGIERIDHIGAQVLWNQWGLQWPAQINISAAQRDIFDQVAKFSAAEIPPVKSSWLARQVDALGGGVLKSISHLADVAALIGQLMFDILRLIRNPRRGPWRDISSHIYQMGATALPITALVGFLIGVVLAYLMSLQLKQFGAETFIVNILGISLVRELGPMLAAILVAGRSGSAITAQIGVMRVTEELDALRVMGIPHGFRLVMPRALALGISMPLVALWTTLAALGGGMLAADVAMGISPGYFVEALPAAVNASNLWLAMGKSVVFGVFIALIGCHWGFSVEPNTQSLGEGTTASVVSAITMVIIVDALFAIAFKNLGF